MKEQEIKRVELCRKIQPIKTRHGSAGRNYYGELRKFRGYKKRKET